MYIKRNIESKFYSIKLNYISDTYCVSKLRLFVMFTIFSFNVMLETYNALFPQHNFSKKFGTKVRCSIRAILDMFRLVAEHLPTLIRDSRIEITSCRDIVLSIFVVIISAILFGDV